MGSRGELAQVVALQLGSLVNRIFGALMVATGIGNINLPPLAALAALALCKPPGGLVAQTSTILAAMPGMAPERPLAALSAAGAAERPELAALSDRVKTSLGQRQGRQQRQPLHPKASIALSAVADRADKHTDRQDLTEPHGQALSPVVMVRGLADRPPPPTTPVHRQTLPALRTAGTTGAAALPETLSRANSQVLAVMAAY